MVRDRKAELRIKKSILMSCKVNLELLDVLFSLFVCLFYRILLKN